MTNLIKQIVSGDGYTQSIKMVVRDNERGPQGEQGEPGPAATIQAGQAYAIPGGSSPAVVNSGTETNAIFDFYIPRSSTEWGDLTGDIEQQADLVPYLRKADNAIQADDIDYTVMTDLDVSSNPSTSNINLDGAKVNLKTGTTSSKTISLPVASSTEAGVMNSATFEAVTANSNTISTILGGMVAIAGLSSSPTQSDLTTAWQTATGLTAPGNYSKILDTDNNKYWTYFENTSLWYHGSADIEASIAPFTNSSDGTIKGSTNTGQVFAENDGTGSVNGWDDLSSAVSNNTNNKLATANLTVGSSLTKTVTGSGAASVVNLAIANGGVTTNAIGDAAVTPAKLALNSLSAYATKTSNLSLTTSFKNYLTVDVSNIPTGATFVVIATATATGNDEINGFVIRTSYNNTNGMANVQTQTWGRTATTIYSYTKVSGANSLHVQGRKDNSNTMTMEKASCVCFVIG